MRQARQRRGARQRAAFASRFGVYHVRMAASSTSELVVTAVGPDRPGLASELTGHVLGAGANLADSRMANLRGQFALLALVEGTSEVLDKLRSRLREAAPAMGLSIDFA